MLSPRLQETKSFQTSRQPEWHTRSKNQLLSLNIIQIHEFTFMKTLSNELIKGECLSTYVNLWWLNVHSNRHFRVNNMFQCFYKEIIDILTYIHPSTQVFSLWRISATSLLLGYLPPLSMVVVRALCSSSFSFAWNSSIFVKDKTTFLNNCSYQGAVLLKKVGQRCH